LKEQTTTADLMDPLAMAAALLALVMTTLAGT